MVFCNNGNPVESFTCESEDAKKKFCDPVKKICVENDVCVQDAELTCKRGGFFPHVAKPGSFVYCPSTSTATTTAKGIEYECPPEYTFDLVKTACTKDKNTFVDFSAKGLCKGKRFQYVAHTIVPSLYTLCSKPDDQISVDMCDTTDLKFDVEKGECVFNCPKEGFFKNPKKAGEYCNCVKVGTEIKPECYPCNGLGTFADPAKFCE